VSRGKGGGEETGEKELGVEAEEQGAAHRLLPLPCFMAIPEELGGQRWLLIAVSSRRVPDLDGLHGVSDAMETDTSNNSSESSQGEPSGTRPASTREMLVPRS
jgi:hypothetical protein